jgi:hypothetical protein
MIKVLFMDKSYFTKSGITNMKKEHMWPDKYLHVIQFHH